MFTTLRRILLPINQRQLQNLCISRVCSTQEKLDVTTDNISFTPDEEEHILKVVNSKTLAEITKYSITEYSANELIDFREIYGPYESLSDLYLIRGMTKQLTHNFCMSIVENVVHKNMHSKSPKPSKAVIFPDVSQNVKKNTRTVLGIHIEHDMICWAHMDYFYKLLNWEYVDLPAQYTKLHTFDTVNTILNITKKIPAADVWVIADNFEKPRFKKHNDALAYVVKQKLTVGLLMYKAATAGVTIGPDFNSLYTVHHRKINKDLNLLVGGETISLHHLTKNIIHNINFEHEDLNIPNVHIPSELKHMYESLPNLMKHQLGESLLSAISFVLYGIYKDRFTRSSINTEKSNVEEGTIGIEEDK